MFESDATRSPATSATPTQSALTRRTYHGRLRDAPPTKDGRRLNTTCTRPYRIGVRP
jgi:hypothetical protein